MTTMVGESRVWKGKGTLSLLPAWLSGGCRGAWCLGSAILAWAPLPSHSPMGLGDQAQLCWPWHTLALCPTLWGAGAGPHGTLPSTALCSPVTVLSHLLINQADCNVFLGH